MYILLGFIASAAGFALILLIQYGIRRRSATVENKEVFPQDTEENEYRYIDPVWLNKMAIGLTAGAVKHPGETWKTIPTNEHLARAMRHINLYRMGDRSEPHLINASMRLMMAEATSRDERGEQHAES